jgi:hypothetical protein
MSRVLQPKSKLKKKDGPKALNKKSFEENFFDSHYRNDKKIQVYDKFLEYLKEHPRFCQHIDLIEKDLEEFCLKGAYKTENNNKDDRRRRICKNFKNRLFGNKSSFVKGSEPMFTDDVGLNVELNYELPYFILTKLLVPIFYSSKGIDDFNDFIKPHLIRHPYETISKEDAIEKYEKIVNFINKIPRQHKSFLVNMMIKIFIADHKYNKVESLDDMLWHFKQIRIYKTNPVMSMFVGLLDTKVDENLVDELKEANISLKEAKEEVFNYTPSVDKISSLRARLRDKYLKIIESDEWRSFKAMHINNVKNWYRNRDPMIINNIEMYLRDKADEELKKSLTLFVLDVDYEKAIVNLGILNNYDIKLAKENENLNFTEESFIKSGNRDLVDTVHCDYLREIFNYQSSIALFNFLESSSAVRYIQSNVEKTYSTDLNIDKDQFLSGLKLHNSWVEMYMNHSKEFYDIFKTLKEISNLTSIENAYIDYDDIA